MRSSSWCPSEKLGRLTCGRRRQKRELEHEPIGAAVSNGHQVDYPRAAGSVDEREREPCSSRSNQRPMEVIDVLADLRERIEPPTWRSSEISWTRNSLEASTNGSGVCRWRA